MRMLLASLVMVLIPARSGAAGEHFACNMKALSRDERAVHQKLSKALLGAVQQQAELGNGYGFRLPAGSLVTAARWVSLERRCCPFFAFEIILAKGDGPLWLRVTGSEGIKAFIRAEFGLDG